MCRLSPFFDLSRIKMRYVDLKAYGKRQNFAVQLVPHDSCLPFRLPVPVLSL